MTRTYLSLETAHSSDSPVTGDGQYIQSISIPCMPVSTIAYRLVRESC